MVEKEEKNIFSVLQPTRQAILEDLKKGRFKPGERLPGERELAHLYGIGRSSMVKVLKQLEMERYVERIPVFGTFVRRDLDMRVDPLRITVASIDSPEQTGMNNPFAWEATSEMLRGLIGESTRHHALHLNWYCCPEVEDEMMLQRQVEDLMESDGIIFNGCGMDELKRAIYRNEKTALTLGPKLQFQREIFPVVDYDRWGIFPRYPLWLSERYPGRPIIMVSYRMSKYDVRELEKYGESFRTFFERIGTPLTEVCLPSGPSDFEELLAVLQKNLPLLHLEANPLVLVLNRALVPPLCTLLRDEHPGIPLAALAGGNCIEGLHGNIPHWREPYYEMGAAAVGGLVECLRNKQPLDDVVFQMQFCEK